MIGAAGDEVYRGVLLFELLGEGAFRRKGNAGLPSSLVHGDDEIE
jgi:hypothetical protein